MSDETPTPTTFWGKVGAVLSSPATALSNMTKNSPAMTLIAILLVIQPAVQTGIDLLKSLAEVKHDLNPETRPVTKAELDLVNQKIDFNNQLILADIQADKEKALAFRHRSVDPKREKDDDRGYQQLQDKLTAIQKHLDSNFEKGKK